MTQVKWKRVGTTNVVIEGEGFFVSYNPDTDSGHGVLTELGNLMGGDLKDGEETALCKANKDGTQEWHILEGDFRKEYEKAFPSYGECKNVYMINKAKHRSNWSTD